MVYEPKVALAIYFYLISRLIQNFWVLVIA